METCATWGQEPQVGNLRYKGTSSRRLATCGDSAQVENLCYSFENLRYFSRRYATRIRNVVNRGASRLSRQTQRACRPTTT